MKSIQRYPIHPTKRLRVELPAGAVILDVSRNIHDLFLHVLADVDAPLDQVRYITAYIDCEEFDGPTGVYIGRTPRAGDYRGLSFFDQTMV